MSPLSKRKSQLKQARKRRHSSDKVTEVDEVLDPNPIAQDPGHVPIPAHVPVPNPPPLPVLTPKSVDVKLKQLSADKDCVHNDQQSKDHQGNFIANISALNKIYEGFPCPSEVCSGVNSLYCEVGRTSGMAMEFHVKCSVCKETVKKWWNSETRTEKKSSMRLINKEAVLGSITFGMGTVRMQRYCEYMHLPSMHHSTFQEHAEAIYKMNPQLRQLIFDKTVAIVRAAHLAESGVSEDDGRIIDICVSTDGSWLTRGHTSKVGVVGVIDVLTNNVLDAHVMSTYCYQCANHSRLSKEAWTEWYNKHIANGECDINFNGKLDLL